MDEGVEEENVTDLADEDIFDTDIKSTRSELVDNDDENDLLAIDASFDEVHKQRS